MSDAINQNLQKGTTTLGLVCKDGVVLAADRRTSGGYTIMHKHADKLVKIDDNMVITTAGLVSDIQLLSKLIRAELKLKKIRTGRKPSVKEAANLLAGMMYNNIRRPSMVPGIVGFLLGGFDEHGTKLYDLGVDGSVMEYKDYASNGSGSTLALGALEAIYKKGMTTKEGVEIAKKAINSAIQRDMPTGNGVDIFVIDQQGARKVEGQAIDYSVK